jgi:hypothetical protein
MFIKITFFFQIQLIIINERIKYKEEGKKK